MLEIVRALLQQFWDLEFLCNMAYAIQKTCDVSQVVVEIDSFSDVFLASHVLCHTLSSEAISNTIFSYHRVQSSQKFVNIMIRGLIGSNNPRCETTTAC